MLFYVLKMKKIIVLFISVFCVQISYTQNLDSLQKVIKRSSGNIKAEALLELSLSHVSKNDSLALIYVNDAIQEITNNEALKGKALFLLGQASYSSSKTKSLEYFNQATTIFEKIEDINLKDAYFEQSHIYTLFSDFPNALNFGLKSLEFNQKNNIEKNIQRDMSFIGYIYDRMYEYKESIKWNRRALVLAQKLEDKNAEAKCFGRIGIAYDELAEKDNFNRKLFDSALFYNLKAVKISEENGDLGFARTTYSNIGNTYSKLKLYNEAEKYTMKSLAVPGFEERKGVTLVNLGKIYLETGRYTEAKKILDSAMQNTIHHGTRKYQFEAFYRLHELDLKKENYKSALQNYIAYKTIEDSLLNETKTKQVAEMSERFKSAEKESQLALTRATIAEQDLSIQQKNVQLYGLAILVILLSSIGYLFYNQQKLKNRQLQKENELKNALVKIETQNRLQEQRLRISRDLHDNIGAQLTFIISSLDNLKYGFNIEDQKLTNKLESISGFTTETIYELRDTIWAMNKNEISFEDLKSRITNFIDKANITTTNTIFEFKCEDNIDKEKTFSSVDGMNIYRIIQEAVNNSIKYAEAKMINVIISENSNKLNIQIKDDGKGFNKQEVEFGNGINNMKKRANELNAELIVKSIIKQGTTITLLKPINT